MFKVYSKVILFCKYVWFIVLVFVLGYGVSGVNKNNRFDVLELKILGKERSNVILYE